MIEVYTEDRVLQFASQEEYETWEFHYRNEIYNQNRRSARVIFEPTELSTKLRKVTQAVKRAVC